MQHPPAVPAGGALSFVPVVQVVLPVGESHFAYMQRRTPAALIVALGLTSHPKLSLPWKWNQSVSLAPLIVPRMRLPFLSQSVVFASGRAVAMVPLGSMSA